MKKILLVIITISFFTACKKNDLLIDRTEISGKWEYITFSGYPFNSPVYPPGNGRIIVIKQNGSFERFSNDTLLFKGQYTLKSKKDCYQTEKKVFFSTNDDSFANGNSIRVENDSLFLSTPSCYADGGTGIYRKIQ